MGLIIPPEPDPFSDDDTECFPAGKTPSIMYAAFTGIIKGADWSDAFPEPPNQIFTLPRREGKPYIWHMNAGFWDVFYEAKGGAFPPWQSWLRLWYNGPPLYTVFSTHIVATCVTGFENGVTEPPNKRWIGGYGSVWHLT